MALLQVDNLHVHFRTDGGIVRAVDGVSFSLNAGETLGIVGESGSGKSVSSLAIMGLIPQPPGKIVAGKAIFDGIDLLKTKESQMRKIRGNRIAMVFQDPMTSLNPFLTVEQQLTEITRLHKRYSPSKARDHAVEMLAQVGIPDPQRRIGQYPHQFSGGMRQRIVIAMALSCEPEVLIADEPTTALDVTIQAQILDLMKKLQQDHGTGIILITHDLGVIASSCHRVNVMYAGRLIEQASVDELFASPVHPYTRGLLESMPRLDTPHGSALSPIQGQPPNLAQLPPGCAFQPRCSSAVDRCQEIRPPLYDAEGGRSHACLVEAQRRQHRPLDRRSNRLAESEPPGQAAEDQANNSAATPT